jgi:glycyl-tRNA synthetase
MPNEHSVEKLTYFDQPNNQHIVPFVIEPAAGVDRGVLAALCEAYDEEVLENGETRIVLRLPAVLAPIKVAVLPLKKNEPTIVETAKKIKKMLQSGGDMRTVYDDTAAIGKLYRRQDEAGTPFCITVDFDTIGRGRDGDTSMENTVTVRHRDSMVQERVAIDDLVHYIKSRIA